MRKRNRQQKSMGQMMIVMGVFVFSGIFLILHVWLPIQAERALDNLKDWEKSISRQKADLRDLKNEVSVVTSLTKLDQWAKSHGPWRSPRSGDIYTIYE